YGAGQSTSIQSEMELIANKDAIANLVCEIIKEKTNSHRFKENEKYFSSDEIKYINSIRLDLSKDELNDFTPENIKARLKTEAVSSSDIVVIKIVDQNPQVAEILANLYAMAYKADFWKSKTLDAEETKKFIEEQLDDIKKQLDARKNILMKSSEQNVYVGSDEVYKDELSKLKIELARLSESYQADHPRIIKLKNLINTIESELAKIPQAKHDYDDNLSDWELKQAMRKTLGEYHLKAEIDYKAKLEKTKDEIQIISMATPGSAIKIRPHTTVNIFAGALFGLILSLIYAFITEGLDTSIGKIEDVERITGLPVIAHIPVIGSDKSLASSFLYPSKKMLSFFFRFFASSEEERPIDIYNNVLFNFPPLSIEAEAYRTLRTNIQFAIGKHKQNGNVVGITSTSPKEGKTLTATNLAIAMAQLGRRTILLEADMRRPKLNEIFKLHKKEGLSDVLIGVVKLEDAISTSSDLLLGGIDWDKLISTTGIDNLHILTSGTIPPNPGELLLSQDFADLIAKLRNEYDYVIVDTPPTLPVADACIVGTVVDGIIMIYQSDKTSRHLLLRALDILRKGKLKIIGIVINQLAFDVVIKSSHYGYEYYSKRTGPGS
ncbi:MAG TPA: AAA family ATPase, partial [Victivallales bacterium]|nr:AAA family ATPase [Victivallales bacterium]